MYIFEILIVVTLYFIIFHVKIEITMTCTNLYTIRVCIKVHLYTRKIYANLLSNC